MKIGSYAIRYQYSKMKWDFSIGNKKAAKAGLDNQEKIWKVPVGANRFDNLILNLSESNFVKHIMRRKSDDGM